MTLTYAEEMRTLAEIAIALAGFSGVVMALKARQSLGDRKVDYARLRELLITSLVVVFFAFLPSMAAGVLGDSPWVWRGPQLLFGIVHVGAMALFMVTAGSEVTSASLWELATVPLALLVIVLQFATALGFFSDYLAASYLLALLWFLLIAAMNFSVLLLQEVPARKGRQG